MHHRTHAQLYATLCHLASATNSRDHWEAARTRGGDLDRHIAAMSLRSAEQQCRAQRENAVALLDELGIPRAVLEVTLPLLAPYLEGGIPIGPGHLVKAAQCLDLAGVV